MNTYDLGENVFVKMYNGKVEKPAKIESKFMKGDMVYYKVSIEGNKHLKKVTNKDLIAGLPLY